MQAANIASERWTHLATSYDANSRALSLLVNGEAAATRTCGAQGLGQILYEPPDPALYLTEEATGEGLVAAGLPTVGMGFALGRLLVADFARTAAECPVLYYQVREPKP